VPSSRWDRPPPPRDWRWVVGGVGRVLIATGLLMFGFVAYQLWGTGLEYAQAQDRLEDDFAELLAGTPGPAPSAPVATTTAETTDTTEATGTTAGTATTAAGPAPSAPPTTPPATAPPVAGPDFAAGEVMARIDIPTIDVGTYVVSGVQPGDLKQGPGHYPDTPQPGQLGNSAIAGHRTTYGQPFYDLDRLAPGDEVVVTSVQGRFVYRVTGSEVVGPDRADVIATTDPARATLTLTTCDPKYTARNRLVVYADLDLAASAVPQPPVVEQRPVASTVPSGPTTAAPSTIDDPTVTSASSPSSTPSTSPATTPAPTTAPAAPGVGSDGELADAFAHGWFSDDAAFVQVALWGLVVSAIAIGAWLLSRRVRRNWVGALVGVVPFVVALYFFFQNVNRLLPAAL
jgi:sortase A